MEVNQTVLSTLVLPLQDPILSRNMYVSKAIRTFLVKANQVVFEKPLDKIYQILDEVNYVIHSAHDWTVAQHLLFLNATNGNFTILPFAS